MNTTQEDDEDDGATVEKRGVMMMLMMIKLTALVPVVSKIAALSAAAGVTAMARIAIAT